MGFPKVVYKVVDGRCVDMIAVRGEGMLKDALAKGFVESIEREEEDGAGTGSKKDGGLDGASGDLGTDDGAAEEGADIKGAEGSDGIVILFDVDQEQGDEESDAEGLEEAAADQPKPKSKNAKKAK